MVIQYVKRREGKRHLENGLDGFVLDGFVGHSLVIVGTALMHLLSNVDVKDL